MKEHDAIIRVLTKRMIEEDPEMIVEIMLDANNKLVKLEKLLKDNGISFEYDKQF